MSGLKVKVLEAPIFDGVAQDLVLKSNNVNRIVIANTGPVSIQSNLSYSGTLTGNTGIINIGSGQIYKDASGNVGIGTSTPIYKLHVSDSTAANSNTDIIGVTSNYFTNAKKSLTWFSGTDAVGRISTVYNTISGEVGIDMTFGSLYNLTAGMNDSELMRLTSAGRLGIGTPLPDAKLTVNGVASFAAGSAGFPSIAGSGDLNTGIFFPAADTIAFSEGGVEAMRIDSSGNVGIGISAVAKLDINGSVGIANRSLKIKPSANGADIPNLRTVFIEHASNDGALSLGFSTSTDAWVISSTYGSTGAYKPLVFATSDLERMRINSSGNVGIGTTAGTTTVSSGLAINNATAANYPGLEIQTAGVTRLYFNANNAESYITSVSTNPLVILTNGSERMRINSSGNIGIGTTTTTYRTNIVYTNSAGGVAETGLYLRNTSTGNSTQMLFDGHRSYSLLVQGSFGAPAGGFTIQDNTAGVARLSIDSSGNLLVGATSTTWTNSDAVMLAVGNGDSSFLHSSVRGDGSRFIWFVYNTNHIGSIAQTGTTSVSYLTTSDYRLKENVAPMTGALATVAALKPVTYNWKVDGSDGQGFIAHELQAVVPDCVTGTKDAIDAEGKPQYQGVDTSFLVATLTAAIQELKSIIDQQDARIKTLEGNV